MVEAIARKFTFTHATTWSLKYSETDRSFENIAQVVYLLLTTSVGER